MQMIFQYQPNNFRLSGLLTIRRQLVVRPKKKDSKSTLNEMDSCGFEKIIIMVLLGRFYNNTNNDRFVNKTICEPIFDG